MLLQLCAVGGATERVRRGPWMFPLDQTKGDPLYVPLQVPEAEVSSCSRLGLLPLGLLPLEAEQLTGGEALQSLLPSLESLLLSTDC